MSYARRSILLTIIVLALGACSDLPTQPDQNAAVTDAVEMASSVATTGGAAAVEAGDRIVEVSVYDLDGVYFQAECADGTLSELIAMTGSVEERITTHTDGSGTLHVKVNSKSRHVSGTGVDSGERYRAREREVATYQQATAGSMGSYRHDFRLVSQATGVEYRLVTRGTYTFDANGELVRDTETRKLECSL